LPHPFTITLAVVRYTKGLGRPPQMSYTTKSFAAFTGRKLKILQLISLSISIPLLTGCASHQLKKPTPTPASQVTPPPSLPTPIVMDGASHTRQDAEPSQEWSAQDEKTQQKEPYKENVPTTPLVSYDQSISGYCTYLERTSPGAICTWSGDTLDVLIPSWWVNDYPTYNVYITRLKQVGEAVMDGFLTARQDAGLSGSRLKQCEVIIHDGTYRDTVHP